MAKKHIKMRTPEGEPYDVLEELVEAKIAAGWKLFIAQDAPSAAQDIPTPSENVELQFTGGRDEPKPRKGKAKK